MTKIEIFIDEVSEIYPILDDIKRHGLIMDDDFYWMYNPTTWESLSIVNEDSKKSIIFSFKQDANASWFALKYSK